MPVRQTDRSRQYDGEQRVKLTIPWRFVALKEDNIL
jgi:hypothetical protein